MTWPLPVGLSRNVPGDLGDSLLNMWILGWGAEQVPRLLIGQISATDFWNANIFHPEPLGLSFSEHLFGQVLQILPVYHLTGNLILCYNLLFLSSFALSGLAMYLLVRDLLGEGPGFSRPAFVAGLIFAFVPFRLAQLAHIQSLSSQWMPLALYGFRRFIVSGRVKPLAWGSAALLMQNWSCGYYLMFFAPFVPLFVAHQMVSLGRHRALWMWGAFAAAGLAVAAGTYPFLALYLEAQRVHGFERSIGEVIRYSADVYSYFTAPEALSVWGGLMQAFPKPEGELFFGIVPILLAAVALIASITARLTQTVAPRSTPGPESSMSRLTPSSVFKPHRVVLLVVGSVIAVQLAGLVGVLLTGGFVTTVAGIPIRATDATRILSGIAIASAILLALSPAARTRTGAACRSPLTLAVLLTILAMWLSLGPVPQSHGRTLQGLGLYRVLYDHVPGFEGLRVPARYAMVAAVFLSIAAGYGAAAARRTSVWIAICAAVLIETAFAPMPLNQTWGDGGVQPPARVEPASDAPVVYQHLAGMPNATVITEFPFGDPAWEIRYVYYATVHWKRLVNGYSGGFPQPYKVRVALLQRVAENPEAAWQALRDTGTTHMIVHEAAFPPGGADVVKKWLTDHAAVEIARFGTDVLYTSANAY